MNSSETLRINKITKERSILIISMEDHALDGILGMWLAKIFLYQPVGIWAMNILGGTLDLRRISCCCVCHGRNFMCLPGETPSVMGVGKEISIGFWSRPPLPAKNNSRLKVIWNESRWQKHLQSCCWKCLFYWASMANRIRISEQRHGVLSRLDVSDGMFAGNTDPESCFWAPWRGCHASRWHFHSAFVRNELK